MTSKTSSADFTRETGSVFRWQVRRIWPILALYAALLLLSLPAYKLLGRQLFFGVDEMWSLYGGIPGTILLGLLLPVLQNGPLFSRRQADLFHALPVRRDALFWGNYLSGLLCLDAPLVFAFATDLVAAGFRGQLYGSLFFERLTLLGFLLLLGALSLAIFTLAAVSSGTYLEYGVSAALLTVCWPVFVQYSDYFANSMIPGIATEIRASIVAAAGSPPLAIALLSGYAYNGSQYGFPLPLWTLPLWAVLTAVFLALGLWAHRRRQSEDAGNSLRGRPLKTALRILACAAAGMFLARQVQSHEVMLVRAGTMSTLIVLVSALAGILVAWVLSELLYYRSAKGLFRHLPHLGGSLALTAAALLAISLGMGLDTAVPDPSQVAGIGVQLDYGSEYSHFSAAEPGDDGFWTSSGQNLAAAVTSPENLEKAARLQQKLLELARARQYPYLPGQNIQATVGERFQVFMLCYYNGAGVAGPRKTYVFTPSTLPETALPLYEECVSLAEEIVQSEEYVKGMYPVNAIDTAVQVSKITGFEVPEGQAAAVPEGFDAPVNREEQHEIRELSDLPGEAAFRKKLEAALFHDLTHGHYRDAIEYAYQSEEAVGCYDILYRYGRRFTARGGLLNGEPAQGKELVFIDTVFHIDDYGDTSATFRVSPEMTETYALLEEMFAS